MSDVAVTIVRGGPGSGKTTALVGQVSQLVASGCPLSDVLVLTGSRVQARALRRLILAGLPGAHLRPRITTLFGWAAGVMAEFAALAGYDEPPVVLSAPQHQFRVRELLRRFGEDRWPEEFGLAASTDEFALQVQDALMAARRLGLAPADLRLQSSNSSKSYWSTLADFFEEYLSATRAKHVIDYTELVHQARLLLRLGPAASRINETVQAILVDEAAELDDAQLALLAQLAALGVPVTVYADESTSVYGFRGGGQGFARRAENAFAALDVPVVWQHLDAEFRQPVSRTCEIFDAPEAELTAIAHHLFAARERGLQWRDMAVITHGTGVASLARDLGAAGVPTLAEGGSLPLSQEPLVAVLRSVLSLLLCLSSDVVQVDVESRVRELATSPLGGIDSLRLLRGKELPALGKLRAHWQTLAKSLEPLESDISVETVLWKLWSASPWPERLREEALGPSIGAQQANESLDAAIAVFDLAAKHLDWCGRSGVANFIELLDEQVLPADHTREEIDRDAVRVLDFYASKGAQWPLVVVTGVKEGSWPATVVQQPLFDLDLALYGARDTAALRRDKVEAERHAFTLATSRATQYLVLTASPAPDEEGCLPSRFVAAAGIPVVSGDALSRDSSASGRPRTLSELVASLRTCTLDAAASPVLREHATQKLRAIAAARDAAGQPLAPLANPDTWWGVGGWSGPSLVQLVADDEPVVLSGSQVGALLACPRQWFLETQARGATRGGVKTQVGTLLHRLFELDAQATLAGGAGVSVASARTFLEERWQGLGWRSPATALAGLEQTLVTFGRYRTWADGRLSRELLAAETRFELRLTLAVKPVIIRGVVDRLERDHAGRVIVIDFKTGKAGKADEYLDQLGCYELAAVSGALGEQFPSAAGPSELVWPAIDARVTVKTDVGCRVTAAPPVVAGVEEFEGYPSEFHSRLARAADIVRSGSFDAIAGATCSRCFFRSSCPALAGDWGETGE
ncbi:MAG: PD-(D/E)XK nuclease family protein [Propionibacteriaceae bacterium]|nr:PD-(D/E)XK nuclease family protein [Propionibacteriaceae bacterium]